MRLNWDYQRADYRLRRMLWGLVRRVRDAGVESNSILARIAASEGGGGDRLSDDALFSEIWELLASGFETIREGLTWSVYLLGKHPEAAARVRDEVGRVVGRRGVRAEDVPELAETEMFFSEAIRLYPPTWMFVRAAVRGDILPTGVRIPGKSKIYLCQYTAHRNERYFPEPERFDPHRFLPEARRTRPKFSYFPFGVGSRTCVAEALARLEGVLVLASVARRFDLRLRPGQQIKPIGEITLRPSGPIWVTARSSSPSPHADPARPTVSTFDRD